MVNELLATVVAQPGGSEVLFWDSLRAAMIALDDISYESNGRNYKANILGGLPFSAVV